MKQTLLITLGALLTLAQIRADDRPNIIIMMADDMGYSGLYPQD